MRAPPSPHQAIGIHECNMADIFCYLRGQRTIIFCSYTSKQLPCFLQIILKTVFWKSLGPDFKGPLSAGLPRTACLASVLQIVFTHLDGTAIHLFCVWWETDTKGILMNSWAVLPKPKSDVFSIAPICKDSLILYIRSFLRLLCLH